MQRGQRLRGWRLPVRNMTPLEVWPPKSRKQRQLQDWAGKCGSRGRAAWGQHGGSGCLLPRRPAAGLGGHRGALRGGGQRRAVQARRSCILDLNPATHCGQCFLQHRTPGPCGWQ